MLPEPRLANRSSMESTLNRPRMVSSSTFWFSRRISRRMSSLPRWILALRSWRRNHWRTLCLAPADRT